MSRSRSMEAISDGGGGSPDDVNGGMDPNQPTLFTRRKVPGGPDPPKRPERPKTALANMRTPGKYPKARSDVLRKMHQPGLFFTHVKM